METGRLEGTKNGQKTTRRRIGTDPGWREIRRTCRKHAMIGPVRWRARYFEKSGRSEIRDGRCLHTLRRVPLAEGLVLDQTIQVSVAPCASRPLYGPSRRRFRALNPLSCFMFFVTRAGYGQRKKRRNFRVACKLKSLLRRHLREPAPLVVRAKICADAKGYAGPVSASRRTRSPGPGDRPNLSTQHHPQPPPPPPPPKWILWG